MEKLCSDNSVNDEARCGKRKAPNEVEGEHFHFYCANIPESPSYTIDRRVQRMINLKYRKYIIVTKVIVLLVSSWVDSTTGNVFL